MTKKRVYILALFCVSFCFIAKAYALNVVVQWNQQALNAIAATSTPPTIASRALAIVHTAIYDAWAAYDDKAIGTQFEALLRRPSNEFTDANKSEAISFAAFRCLLDLFPTQSAAFTTEMAFLGYNPADVSTDITTPVGIGNVVAENLLLFRHEDGSNQLADEPNTIAGAYSDYTGYTSVNTSTNLVDPSRWQPLTPTAIFLTPQWGQVKAFAIKSGNEFQPGQSPATYPSDRYTEQAEAVLKFSAQLSDKTKSITVYWADGPGTVTPPGHWNLFAQFISARDNNSLGKDVRLYFALNNALLDASIAAWDAKRTFDSVRPISAIRFLFDGVRVLAWGGPCQGTEEILGQTWQPYISTPSFPEFVSGHSTFSAAAAEVFRLFTGSNRFDNSATVLQGSSFAEPGCAPTEDVTLSWKTFTQAANQAGLSRRYGGIHFKNGDHEGRKLGRKVGQAAFERAQYFINGGGAG